MTLLLGKFPIRRSSRDEIERAIKKVQDALKVRGEAEHEAFGRSMRTFLQHIRWLEEELEKKSQPSLVSATTLPSPVKSALASPTNILTPEPPKDFSSKSERAYEAMKSKDTYLVFLKWTKLSPEQCWDLASSWAYSKNLPKPKTPYDALGTPKNPENAEAEGS